MEREEKRSLGLVILRGELVVSMSIESGPPPSLDASKQGRAAAMPGPGMGRAAGRGMPIAPGAVPGKKVLSRSCCVYIFEIHLLN